LTNIFSLFTTLPFEITDDLFYAFPALDNKADTLKQSQMLKASNSTAFIASQPKEISGLQNLGVFDIKPIAEKPPEAHWLSYIWNFHRKRNPMGDILKHKSRLCVDGSQQEFGWDYCDVYALIVSWPPFACFSYFRQF
jgi:hypothetical protein